MTDQCSHGRKKISGTKKGKISCGQGVFNFIFVAVLDLIYCINFGNLANSHLILKTGLSIQFFPLELSGYLKGITFCGYLILQFL